LSSIGTFTTRGYIQNMKNASCYFMHDAQSWYHRSMVLIGV
jgi:hypothetical protein